MKAKEQAISFNNLGVEFFIHHRIDEAAAMFDGAVHALAQTMDLDLSSSEVQSKADKATHLFLAYRRSAPFLPTPPEVDAAKTVLLHRLRSQQDPNIRSSMYRKAFRVVTSERLEPTLGANELQFIASIAIYNRALCHHLKACNEVLNQEEIDRARTQAAMLYNLCYEVTVPLADSLGHFLIFVRLIMASVNNLALLLYETAEYDKSRHYLKRLEDFATFHCAAASGDHEFTMQRATFLLNTILLKPPATAPCA